MKIADTMVESKPRHYTCEPIQLIHPKSGQVFRSSKEASEKLNINRNTIYRDINVGRHKYGLFQVGQYSN